VLKERQSDFLLSKKEFRELSQEILNKGGIFRTRVNGRCMFPLIQDNDFIHLKAIPAQEIRIGDIVVYRENTEMMHLYLAFAKPSVATDETLIGKVIAIERKNKFISLEKKFSRLGNLLLALFSAPRILQRSFLKHRHPKWI
jgi:hypothetical protein